MEHVTWAIIYIAPVILIVMIVYRRLKNKWKKKIESHGFDEVVYNGRAFRDPLNLGVAVLSILLPVASGLLAYIVSENRYAVIDPLVWGDF